MRVLVVNAGSSSLKLRVVGADDTLLAARDIPAAGGRFAAREIAGALADLGEPDAVGHRIVHGGDRFIGPVALDDEVVAVLRSLTELAPLHQPKSLAALDAVREALSSVPAVACFDTAFHATLPPAAATYALPQEWRERWPLRRYGFHGLSHAYAARRAAELLSRPASELRLVICHLGAGASLAAVAAGRSVDTTMGFTPLEGLVMATRSGSVDPGLLLWVQRHGGLSVEAVESALEHESGLLGISGVSADMREVLTAGDSGDARAELALGVYLHRLRAGIAAMAASMGGVDALVFTGGVGENSARVRADACGGLDFLGVAIDDSANCDPGDGDAELSAADAPTAVLLVHAREDLEIARQTRELLAEA